MNSSNTAPTRFRIVESPIGPIQLLFRGDALTGLYMDAPKRGPERRADWLPADDSLADSVEEALDEYFAGERRDFDVPLELEGTAWQKRVWEGLLCIPYGETWSYGQLARHVGSPRASRAVGAANGRNPISIIVPCHRVIGSDGSLTGFGGGLERKRHLLQLEVAGRPVLC